MATVPEDSPAPAIRFKRRKIAHPKRAVTEDDAPNVSTLQSSDAATRNEAQSPPAQAMDEEESVPNLKEILRNRRRPRDRLKEATRKIEEPNSGLVVQEHVPRPDQYTSRFVAQTGQVVDQHDKQMSEYVEARMAEKNYRQYGWPIQKHLQATVAAIAPDLKPSFGDTVPKKGLVAADAPVDTEHSNRLAAGQGKLQEVDLGPEAAARSEEAWKRLHSRESAETPTSAKPWRNKYGYAWRRPKANGKTDEDVRRDKMVEAVLSEAKLSYFDTTPPSTLTTTDSCSNNMHNPTNEDALVEQFRTEYFESMEAKHQMRKPPAAPVKGAPPVMAGPKLGGSKSARAKMHKAQQEEAAAKKGKIR
ncbi:hypothetical protein PTNB85_05567 [Pyrenophora teres f. teres]|uniref:Uncharacterized protein n=1 Tax=Pyrenophora teres f. teres TaxID=97479 RepID=A0A6S6VPY1_9PLEO|nr:hypothetical protein HRS9139_03892 [Pyrenophora teres f. teres]KAE8838232.1 hypothetical protein PTNB85_05567 [Pyrenophora teres f. teres]KAE8863060.1 hypothetical protein PTNB29_05622 [Pyrenophora teres f. teres]CAE7000084.1 hypothetical protein PTTW11_01002 [Pyrenophora teres f. teres]